MATKGKVFRGTPLSSALLQPYTAPAHPGIAHDGVRTGVPWGIDLKTHKLLLVDGFGLKEDGFTNGLITRVDGVRNAGKSAFMKSLVIRLMGTQAGLDEDGYPISFRCRITDQKPEDGKPEYAVLTEALRSRVISPIKDGQVSSKINPFDPTMGDEMSILETSINLAETVLNRTLRGFEPLAHQIAVSKMYHEFRDGSSPEVLERILLGLQPADVNAYYREHGETLKQGLKYKLDGKPEMLEQLHLLVDKPHVIPRQAFEQDAAQQAAVIGQLIRGDYGGLFGEGMSMRELLTQPVATIDRTGMSLKVRTIFEALMWRWQTWALENNDLDLIPHLNVGDEEADAYQSLMYLRFYDDFVRKARAFHTWDFKATQFSSRLNKIGAEGSEARDLARSIDLGVSMRIIGKQPKDEDVLNDLTSHGLSDADAYFCTNLETGCFGLKLPDWPVVFFQYILTPIEMMLVESNAANRRMMQRANVYSFEQIRQRAETIGTLSIGAGDGVPE